MDSPNSLGYVTPSCLNGISDTLRPLTSEWTYPNVAGKPIPCFRDAVMLKSACRYAFVGISGRSSRPRVFIGFSPLWPRVDAGSNPAEGTNNLSAKERRWKKHSKISHTSSHALPTKENRRACKSAGGCLGSVGPANLRGGLPLSAPMSRNRSHRLISNR